MFEEKNRPTQPPQNLPPQGDRETEEKKLFGETEETFSGPIKPPPTIPKEFLTKRKKSPILLIIVVIIVIVVIVALAQSSVFKISSEKQAAPSTTPPTNQPVAPQVPAPIPPVVNQIIDTDGDGLTDEQETSLGTNIQSTDSDSDGLFDFEEVKIYKTDPLNADTDGDGYKDGEEVRTGYNPKDATPKAKLLDLVKEIEKEKIQ